MITLCVHMNGDCCFGTFKKDYEDDEEGMRSSQLKLLKRIRGHQVDWETNWYVPILEEEEEE